MAEKGFGVKEINLIGSSGTPTIESPNNLNLNANNVAISTNVSIGGTLTVTGNISVGGTLTYEDVTNIDSIGIITARTGIKVTGGELAVGNNIKLGNAGVITATSFSGDGSALTGISGSGGVAVQDEGSTLSTQATTLNFVGAGVVASGTGATKTITISGGGGSSTPTTSDIQVVYEITNQTSFSYFRFAGNGVDSSANNPDIYLERGQKYRFINNSGGTSHPFEIQTTGGSAYNTGVTNNGASTGSSSKNIDFAVRWDAPSQLKYQCQNHGSMQGNIFISGGDEGRSTTSAATGSIAQAAYADITIPTTGKTFALLKIAISAPAWVILYTDTSSRTSDAAGTGSGRSEGTDPTPGSGVLAEVSTTTSGASTFKMTPGLIGWNDDGTPAAQVYARVYNKRATSGSNAITVTLTSVIMEV